MVLAVSLVPLLFPLRGLLHGRPYTHAWAGFLALAYFVHGVVEAWSDPSVRGLALAATGFSALFFVGSVAFTRWHARELRAQGLPVR
jgi:uncharacterized membrane protein